ncbi:MAG: DNA polymerase III subunit gamma/tau [Tissierellia bacterium]|nr:DNA polymerase III subunit gamma/tau [Tissierellia bacterium]
MAKALYRKYRPKTFDEVLGQEHVTSVLKNQIKTGKISHAYLFSGERGCGKTSCAKIFAKAVNCLNPKDGSPCNECENCKTIINDETLDVVEMDAASNRGIDDIRQIREKVIYPPNKLKYKVYIIDEAHMITREAFNALLKIMEEPPKHLIFILATTEIEKIPATILSRVQKFEFNSINSDNIIKQIDIILNDMNIEMDMDAKYLIVEKANGAMRDALSILDQILSIGNDSYSLDEVEKLLGKVDYSDIDSLLKYILEEDRESALNTVFKLRKQNKASVDILEDLTEYLRDIMLYKTANIFDSFKSESKKKFIIEESNNIDINRIIDSLEILIDYKNKMRNSDSVDLLFEVCIIRLIEYKSRENILSRLEALERNKVIVSNEDNSYYNQNRKTNEYNFNEVKETTNKQKPVDSKKENHKKESINIKEKKSIEDFSLTDFYSIIKEKMGFMYAHMICEDNMQYDKEKNILKLNLDDDMNYQIFMDKSENIAKILKDFTKTDIKVKISKGSQKELNQKQDTDIEINKKEDDELLSKLKDIFGNTLEEK